MIDSPSRESITAALSKINDPDLNRDIVSLGMIKDLSIDGGTVRFTFELTTPACPVRNQFEQMAREAVAAVPGVTGVEVKMTANVRGGLNSASGALEGVRNVIAIGSGKGGVGKSTVSVNLAAALVSTGARVGLMDADIYGPTVPGMLAVTDRPLTDPSGQRIIPVQAWGMKVISMGLLMGDNRQAVVWRGPMVGKAVTQMLTDVDWGELDYLLIDLPPGTGDASLSIAQAIPLSGVAVVCTPQRVAVEIAVKAAAMFRSLRVPVLGLIENMSYYECSNCGHQHHPFAQGGAEAAAAELKVQFLGMLPLAEEIREGADIGRPASTVEGSAMATAFRELATKLAAQVSIQAFRSLPVINVS